MKGNSNLCKLVSESQNNNKKSMEELYNMFIPLLKKYSWLSHSEDSYSELTLKLLECIHKIPVELDKFRDNDGLICAYINTSIKNEYIRLNKKCESYENNIVLSEDFTNYLLVYKDKDLDDDLLVYEAHHILDKLDFKIFILKYFRDYTDCDIGELIGISKQAVNKRLKKIGKLLYDKIYA